MADSGRLWGDDSYFFFWFWSLYIWVLLGLFLRPFVPMPVVLLFSAFILFVLFLKTTIVWYNRGEKDKRWFFECPVPWLISFLAVLIFLYLHVFLERTWILSFIYSSLVWHMLSVLFLFSPFFRVYDVACTKGLDKSRERQPHAFTKKLVAGLILGVIVLVLVKPLPVLKESEGIMLVTQSIITLGIIFYFLAIMPGSLLTIYLVFTTVSHKTLANQSGPDVQ